MLFAKGYGALEQLLRDELSSTPLQAIALSEAVIDGSKDERNSGKVPVLGVREIEIVVTEMCSEG